MKTLRPLKLGVGARVIPGPDRLVISVTAAFELGGEEKERLATEPKLWAAVREQLGEDMGLDEGLPKVRGEVLVHGSAFAPGGTPCPVCQVRVTVGAIDKRLAVFGDRRWQLIGMSEPAPFTQKPVDWAHAFGGEGYEQNPEGKGLGEAREPGALPNVEDPARLIGSPSDRPSPAGFAPIPAHFAERQRKFGTYDQAWLKHRAPLPPEDFDPSVNNVGPEDQQLRGGFFRGDEAVRIENMHPDAPWLEGKLPDVAVRVFAKRKGDEAAVELEARLDTLHLLPGAKMGAAIFRAVLPVEDDEADDVAVILAAAEDRARPRSREHYEQAMARRLDPKKGHHYALYEVDLLPEGEPSGLDMDGGAAGGDEDLLGKSLRRRAERELERARAELRARGIDPDQHMPAAVPEPERPPTLEELPDYLERSERERGQLEAEMEAKLAEAEAKRAVVEAEARRACEKAGVDYDEKVRSGRRGGGGPPKRVESYLDDLAERRKLAENTGVDFPDVDAQLADPRLREKLAAAYEAMLLAYRRLAHEMPAADRVGEDASRALRDAVERARDAREPLKDRDLTGADLRGLDLSNVDLSGALLEAADLSGADLRGANLSSAVLARANLSGADLTGAKLDHANLGDASLTAAKLEGASLREAVLTRADLTSAGMRRSDLRGATLGEARLHETDLSEADFAETTLIEIKLAGQKLAGIKLRRAILLQCDLTGADLQRADLEQATLLRCRADRADLRDIEGTRLCVVDGSSLEGADLRGAKLARAAVMETSLRGADLSGATLDGANFQRSDLTGAKLYRASARGTRLRRASLDDASLVACNFAEADLGKASLRGANFTGANLFRADMTRSKISAATRFDDAEMTLANAQGQVKT